MSALLCRLCACAAESWLPLFEGEGLLRQIPAKLALLPVAVGQGDALPQVACSECIYQLDTLSQFFERVSTADTRLKEIIQASSATIKVEESGAAYLYPTLLDSTNYILTAVPGHVEAAPCVVSFVTGPATLESPPPASTARQRSRRQAPPEPEPASPEEATPGRRRPAILRKQRRKKKKISQCDNDLPLDAPSSHLADTATQAPSIKHDVPVLSILESRLRGIMTGSPAEPQLSSPTLPQINPCLSLPTAPQKTAKLKPPSIPQKTPKLKPPAEPQNSVIPPPQDSTIPPAKPPLMYGTLKPTSVTCSKTCSYGCSVCRLVFPTSEEMDSHLASHEPVLRCCVCLGLFSGMLELQEHHKSCSSVVPAPRPPLKLWRCVKCDKTSTKRGLIFSHMVVHTEQRRFRCSVCEAAFKTAAVLWKHQRILHDPTLGFSCDLCGRAFALKGILMKHIQSAHLNLKPFQCEICGKSFLARNTLTLHRFTIHGVGHVTTYTCHVCQRGFTCKSSMESHVEIHLKSVEERRVHLCPLCGIRSTSKYALKKHIQCHPESGFTRKLHPCHVCGKQLFSAKSLSQHLVLHSGLKSFVCEQCGKAFATENTLRTHMVTHGGERRYACSVCSGKFTQRSSLVSHMERQHGVDARVRRFKKSAD